MKAYHEKALQESCYPHLNHRTDIALTARAPATQSSYPSPPLTSPAHLTFMRDDRTKNTPGAQTALPQAVHMQQTTPSASNSDSRPPQGARPIMQIGNLRTSSPSSRNKSSNPPRHLEPQPQTNTIVPARPSTAVVQPSDVHQS